MGHWPGRIAFILEVDGTGVEDGGEERRIQRWRDLVGGHLNNSAERCSETERGQKQCGQKGNVSS